MLPAKSRNRATALGIALDRRLSIPNRPSRCIVGGGYPYALMAPSSGTKLGPYEILVSLAAGGTREVYREHDTKLQAAI